MLHEGRPGEVERVAGLLPDQERRHDQGEEGGLCEVPWVIFGILLLPPPGTTAADVNIFLCVAVGCFGGRGGPLRARRCDCFVQLVSIMPDIFNHWLFPATTVQAQQICEACIDAC